MALAAEGAHVVVATRSTTGQTVVDEITARGRRATWAHCDVADRDAIEAEPAMEERLARHIPLGRIGDPEHNIGSAVAFLVGPQARYVTGQTLGVDGGHYTNLQSRRY